MEYVDERIASIESALSASHDASVDDTKSSAGDKYETTREMMQQEISRNSMQLMEAKKLRISMNKLSPDSTSSVVKPGSYVCTSNGDFYISISAGLLQTGEKATYAVSQFSPIGKLLLGLQSGETITVNNKIYTILTVV